MTDHSVIQECIDCIKSWQDTEQYGDTGYDDAILVLKAVRDGYKLVPAEGEVNYVDANTLPILYKVTGFLKQSNTLPYESVDRVINQIYALINHNGDMMFVTNIGTNQ